MLADFVFVGELAGRPERDGAGVSNGALATARGLTFSDGIWMDGGSAATPADIADFDFVARVQLSRCASSRGAGIPLTNESCFGSDGMNEYALSIRRDARMPACRRLAIQLNFSLQAAADGHGQ